MSTARLPSRSEILHEHVGENFKVPGVPYEDNFDKIRTVILNECPTLEDVNYLISTSDRNQILQIWPLCSLGDLQEYTPTTYEKMSSHFPGGLESLVSLRENGRVSAKDKVLLQLQTELHVKSATIDAAIINHKRRNLGTVVSKVHHLNRLLKIGSIYGHLGDRKYPLLFGDMTNPENWDKVLSDVKRQFVEFIEEVPQGNRRYEMKTRGVSMPDSEIVERFPYVEWLKDTLGDNLVSILLYGSAARTEDPKKYHDFDNLVRVRDLRKAHEALAGTGPAVYRGKTKEFRDKAPPKGAKQIGIHLFDESAQHFLKYMRFLHDSREFLDHTHVLYGEVPFWKVAIDEVIERGVSNAYLKLRTSNGTLNQVYVDPSRVIGHQALFEFFVKTPRFFLQHTLNAIQKPRFRGKEELDSCLAKRGILIPQYQKVRSKKANEEYIRQCMKDTAVSIFKIQHEFSALGRRPDFAFLSDGKKFSWYGKDIDNWESASRFDNVYTNELVYRH